MAENLAVKKSAVDTILECPLCLHQLTLPQTLHQCLHSYCKSCLDKVPQKTQDGRQGWICPMCDNFTQCDQIQQSSFLEELQTIHNEPEHWDEIKCEQCSEDCGLATWKCEDCKIGLCESAKIAHLRIPMLKSHKVVPLNKEGEKLIDSIVFCKVHDDVPLQINCCDCDQLICYSCSTTDHKSHTIETVDKALERILPKTESSARQVDENIDIMEAQIEGVKKQMEQTKESYASCRMQMDEHLEKVICRIRAMKAQMEEDVNEQESIALDLLKDIKQQLEKQLTQARILSNLTAVVTTKTRHTIQLQQLQNGLFEKVKTIGASKNEDIHLELPVAKFIEGHRIKEELEDVFGGLRFNLKGTKISTSGEVWMDNSLCHDFEAVADFNFEQSLEIDTGAWCNRISLIDNNLWLPVANETLIQVYNNDGKLEKNIDTGGKEINVVREAYDGALICGGHTGLYITTKDCKELTILAEGMFSDVVVHHKSFFALEYGSNEYIHSYSWEANNHWRNMYKHKLVANELLNLNVNSTLCFSCDHFWISSALNKVVYNFSDKGTHLGTFDLVNVNPNFCQVDDIGKALIADFQSGYLYLLDMIHTDQIQVRKIWLSVRVVEVSDAVFDSSNNDLWTLSGNGPIKLTKFTQANVDKSGFTNV